MQLLYFNIAVEEKQWVIKDGDWSDLKQELQNITYDGASVYGNLKSKMKNTRVLIFIDGNKLLKNEIYKNYTMEEFEFNGGNVAGEWIINVKSLDNFAKDANIPYVIKTTIYQDFGQVSQNKQELLAYMTRKGEKKNVIKLQVQ